MTTPSTDPRLAEAIQHHDLGHFVEAEALYLQILDSDPNQPDALHLLGVLAHETGNSEFGVELILQALQVRPDVPLFHFNLGAIFHRLGQLGSAIEHLQIAIALRPNYIEAYEALGTVYQEDLQLDAAFECYRKLLELGHQSAKVYSSLGDYYQTRNQTSEAISYYEAALEIDPHRLSAEFSRRLVLPIIYQNPSEIDQYRRRFEAGLNDLIETISLASPTDRKQALDTILAHNNFYLAYQGHNDRDLQQRYGQLLQTIIGTHFPEYSQPLKPLSPQAKIKLGYVSHSFNNHTVAKLCQGWITQANSDRFEIYGYYIGKTIDQTTHRIRQACDSFFHCFEDIEQVAKRIRSDQLHILVFPDIGMFPGMNALAAMRLAPIQCTSWMHPVTSGLSTIDYFLSSELMEPETGNEHYSEQLIRLPNIGIYYTQPTLPQQRSTRQDFGLDPDRILYLCCQSLFKYLPQYDTIYADIAARIPQAQFIFLRSSCSLPIVQDFKDRLQLAFEKRGLNSEFFCLFLPSLDQDQYFNLNLVSDIFLDSFAWSGGNTTLEALACELPVLTCPGSLMRGRHTYGILRLLGLTEMIAQTESEYIEIAVKLGTDPEFRASIRQRIRENKGRIYHDRACIEGLEAFYESCISERLA